MKKIVTIALGAITLLAPLAIGAYCIISGSLAIITAIAGGYVTAELITYAAINIIAGSVLAAPTFIQTIGASLAQQAATVAQAAQQPTAAQPAAASAKKAA